MLSSGKRCALVHSSIPFALNYTGNTLTDTDLRVFNFLEINRNRL
ncbi:hypothetical protein LEP1GSC166_2394 [Leptospira kirschneri]|nr:hypothetical protein LEP1GSC198_2382 [Leptospira kirschneri str. JB]EMK03611.1 hypothetical protein LEP1GSC166_2394 [Leptospira kirschneri]